MALDFQNTGTLLVTLDNRPIWIARSWHEPETIEYEGRTFYRQVVYDNRNRHVAYVERDLEKEHQDAVDDAMTLLGTD